MDVDVLRALEDRRDGLQPLRDGADISLAERGVGEAEGLRDRVHGAPRLPGCRSAEGRAHLGAKEGDERWLLVDGDEDVLVAEKGGLTRLEPADELEPRLAG